jgi:hypothetical protein
VFADSKVARQKNVYLGSGAYDYFIKIPSKAFFDREKPIKAVVSAKKK